MTDLPRFSIVVCNYNYGRFVGAAVASCLAQSYPTDRFEVIVVDDGSTDESREVLAALAQEGGVTVILQENRGQLAALVAGIARARYELLCFLDSDDTFAPDKLARIAARVGDLAPLPQHFFLCHDVELIDEARGTRLERSWLEMMGAGRFGPSLHIDHVERDFPFSIPAGLVIARDTARTVADTVTAWEWRGGADMVLAHGAFLICSVVHYLPECLAQYRIHGDNRLATIQGGTFAPRPLWVSRWPKLAHYLEHLLAVLDLDVHDRASRIAHLKRLERIARHTSTTHRFAEPTMGFVICGGDPAHLAATIDACLAQGHPKVAIAVAGSLGAAVPSLPPRLVSKVSVAAQAATPLADLAAGYAAVGGDYVCFLASGDLPDTAFAERHLYVHRFGAVCHLTSSDFRVVDAGDTMLHSNVMSTAGRYQYLFETLAPFSSPIEEWTFPPMAANVFRRSAFLDRLFAETGEAMAAFGHHPAWILLQGTHNLSGSVRLNECLTSVRVADAADVSYARLLAPLAADGTPEEPDPLACAAALGTCFGRNETGLRRHLSAGWWSAFADWLCSDLQADETRSLEKLVADAGGTGLAELLASRPD